MKKVILVDGNNLLFRSYYATAYTGNIMKNSEGFPTNALFGFVNMMNKIIMEEKPSYIAVAFDVGKTFRHEQYENYKEGRIEMPDDLRLQFPIAKKILDAMGIKYLECDNYEADDIIGTLARMVDENDDFIATVISSDRDLLQLISSDVDVKLLRQKDYIKMNRDIFFETYKIEPIRIIDLKGLQGDSSDNIKGVKGIGEKTALKLLQEYNSIENIYENINKISGSVKTKLESGKEDAFVSKKLATICKDAPLNVSLEDITYEKENTEELIKIYNDLNFYSLLKKVEIPKNESEFEIKIIKDLKEINITKDCSIYLELNDINYHTANILGMGVYNEEDSFFIDLNLLKQNPDFLTKINKSTYDLKKTYVSLTRHNIKLNNINFDLMIAAYLLNYNLKEDIAYLANSINYQMSFYDKKEDLTKEDIARRCIERAKFIYENKERFTLELDKEEVTNLFFDIEMPLSLVLAKMELEGVRVNTSILEEMKEELIIKIELISKDIYNYAGEEFNISSPKQLGEILFVKLKIPSGKKTKTGYSTDNSVLVKLQADYPIIDKILEYRMLTKLYSTYIEGILNVISSDGKIHTIYTQTLTRTGRLSSIEPNLQNIPVRNEYGRLIRKAFVPEDNSLMMSADYSQIELRIFAHLSSNKDLIEAFNNNMDIHTHTAMDIFHVPYEGVTKDMRGKAKAVNFGILYGISSFGLSEDLQISMKESKEFINTYFETYPGIKDYMNKMIEGAHQTGYVKTIMNRKRIIDELNNTNYMIKSLGERMALNTPIQGSSADILKKAMVEIDREFIKHNIKSTMLLQVHDELIFNCLKEEKDIVKKIVADIMENTFKLNVPLVVDINFGNNWYEAK